MLQLPFLNTAKSNSKRALFLILALSLLLRSYQLFTPLADWHSFRQADTASVAREYSKNGIDILRPQYHDLSSIQSGYPNPNGYRMVEFPLIPALVAASFPVVQGLNIQIHIWYRVVNIVFSLFSILFLYRIMLFMYSQKIALTAAFLFGVLPFSVYYSRTTLPEVAMITFALGGIYFSLKSTSKNSFGTNSVFSLLLSSIFFSLSFLLKPFALIFLPPALLMILMSFIKKPINLIFGVLTLALSIIPLYLWRQWITQFPEGIPYSAWLYNIDGIRLRPAWFRWLFYERLTKLILGFSGIIPFVAGIFAIFKLNRAAVFIWTWVTTSLAYLIIIATGNVRHDYYQYMLTPLIAILLSLGINHLTQRFGSKGKNLAIFSLIIGLVLSANTIKGYYQINHWAIVTAGRAVDRLTPQDAIVVAPYMGDTAFLYQTNRRGFPFGMYIDEYIQAGADYYVTVNFDDEARELEAKYETIEKTNDYLLLKLN